MRSNKECHKNKLNKESNSLKKNKFGNKEVITISMVSILVTAVLIASYILVIMPKLNNNSAEEVANLDKRENVKTGEVSTDKWNLNRVNIVNDAEGIPVPVPKGYVASGIEGENTINTGFVIYEGEEQVTEENKEEAQKTRNQYVWVPIYDPSEVYGTDKDGFKHGKLYDFDANGRTARNWTESNGVMRIKNSYYVREPDIIRDGDNNQYLPMDLSEYDRESLLEEMQMMFMETMESIEKYGGFYIGRYETGGLSGEAKVVRGNEDIGNQNWYTMYTKSKMLKGTNESVITSMMWGSQWDATLEWLVDSGSKTYSEVGVNSTSWGNLMGSTVSCAGLKRPTGYREEWKANNIYDMAGNMWEWTLEVGIIAGSYNNRECRGGYFNNDGYCRNYPAGIRYDKNYFPFHSGYYVGSRGVLYVLL